MRAVVTRVSSARVTVKGQVTGEIGRGYLVLLGVGPEDTPETAKKLADKICNLRVFEDENGKMNLNLAQVEGETAGGLTIHPLCRRELPPPQLHRRSRGRAGEHTLQAVYGILQGEWV